MRKHRDPRQASQPTGLKSIGLTNGSHHSEFCPSKGKVNDLGYRDLSGHFDSKTNGSMNGRVNGMTNGQSRGRTNGFYYGRTNGFTNGRTNGRTNGKTNGFYYGRTNGFTNGRRTNGRTNGRINGGSSGRVLGRTNGLTNGFVNGAGAVNGFRLSYQQRRVAVRPVNMRRRIAAVIILVGIIVSVPFVLVYTFPSEEVEIDGYFMDWLKAQVYRDRPDSPNPDISLEAYAMKHDARGTYFYIETAGNVFEGRENGADGFFVFVDRDDNPTTGYSVRGLGADMVSVIVGWNRTVQRGQTLSFNGSAGQNDFNGFEPYSAVSVAFKGGRMEFSTAYTVSAVSKVAIVARHTNMTGDWSEVNFRSRGSSIRVVQDHDASDVIVGAGDRHIMRLTIEGKGERTSVVGLRFNLLGNVTPLYIKVFEGPTLVGISEGPVVDFIAPLSLADRDRKSLDVIATLPLDVTRGSFGLELDEARGLLCSQDTVWHIDTVQTGARVSYLGSPPSDIAIDGAFADWSSRVPFIDPLGDAYSARTNDSASGDVDLHTVKIASTDDVASFYMAVNGTMLGGSSVPASMVRWVTPGPPAENITVLKEPLLGADFAMVFIDTDMNQSTGFYIGGSEAAVAVIGKNGRILSSEILTLERGLWNSVGPAEAALDNYQLELSASYEALGLVQGATYAVTFVAQDWSGRQDDIALALPARTTAGTKAFGGIMINEVYDKPAPQNDWVELYNTGTVPINMAGWQLWVDGMLVATFPSVTVLPGEFYVVSKNAFEGGKNFVLTDATGAVIDQLSVPSWVNGKSYGRTGSPPYSETGPMSPTPGRLNVGQVAIPEFGDVAIPIAIMPVIVFLFRRFGSRRRA